jgi:hypothetical protein
MPQRIDNRAEDFAASDLAQLRVRGLSPGGAKQLWQVEALVGEAARPRDGFRQPVPNSDA